MMTAEILLAAALLTSQEGHPDFALTKVLRPNILALALDAEVLDPREKGFVMGQDLIGDLVMLQGRYAEFAGVPMLDEADRFPDRKLINEFLALNRAVRNLMVQRRQIDLVHQEEIDSLIHDIDMRYQILDCVRDFKADYFYVSVRRQSLSLLRELIGARAFYSGELPSPTPH